MVRPREVNVDSLDPRCFQPLVGQETVEELLAAAGQLQRVLGKRRIWNISSTALGGGVAEMLYSLLGYTKGAGVNTSWLVIQASSEVFKITKRIHHAMHGEQGDGTSLDDRARSAYEKAMQENLQGLRELISPGEVVLLHDPQTAGLAPGLLKAGVHVVWRCHIGNDVSNDQVELAWRFLWPYLKDVPVMVFSRRDYVPDFLDHKRSKVIQPSIDVFSPKNQEMDGQTVQNILVHTGLIEGPPPEGGSRSFHRADGSTGYVERAADLLRLGRAPAWETPLVVQVSRWDPLKDAKGVIDGFHEYHESVGGPGADLVLAGPNVHAVADDPEGARVFDEVVEHWRALPHALRSRVHLAMLPMADREENAAIVNALQRHAAVVVQKSLREGFGLTVTEAMWKSRPVLASAVGGIQDQIEDGVHGLLLRNPRDGHAFSGSLYKLLNETEFARRLGAAAHQRAREKFIGIRHLMDYAQVVRGLVTSVKSS